jgi:hypothetical protein
VFICFKTAYSEYAELMIRKKFSKLILNTPNADIFNGFFEFSMNNFIAVLNFFDSLVQLEWNNVIESFSEASVRLLAK